MSQSTKRKLRFLSYLVFLIFLSTTAKSQCIQVTPGLGPMDVAPLYGDAGTTWCGTMPVIPNPNAPEPFCAGSDDNVAWLSFIPSSRDLTINFSFYNCLNGDGLQCGAYKNLCDIGNCQPGNDLSSNCWAPVAACNPGAEGNGNGLFPFILNGLSVGDQYYMLIDGWAGDICDFEIEVFGGTFLEPGGERTISGNLYHDLNQNGQFDLGEPPVGDILPVLSTDVMYGGTFSPDSIANGLFEYNICSSLGLSLNHSSSDCWVLSSDSSTYHIPADTTDVSGLDFGFVQVPDFYETKLSFSIPDTVTIGCCNAPSPNFSAENDGCTDENIRLGIRVVDTFPGDLVFKLDTFQQGDTIWYELPPQNQEISAKSSRSIKDFLTLQIDGLGTPDGTTGHIEVLLFRQDTSLTWSFFDKDTLHYKVSCDEMDKAIQFPPPSNLMSFCGLPGIVLQPILFPCPPESIRGWIIPDPALPSIQINYVDIYATSEDTIFWKFDSFVSPITSFPFGFISDDSIPNNLIGQSLTYELHVEWLNGGEEISQAHTLLTDTVECDVIFGSTFWDTNENGLQDSTEAGLNNIGTILNPGSLFTFTDTNGQFRYYVETDTTYQLSYQPQKCWKLTTDSISYTILYQSGPSGPYSFGFAQDTSFQSFQPQIAMAFPRCDNIVEASVFVQNNGCQNSTGQVAFVLDSLLMLDSITTPPTSISGDTLFWDLPLMAPNEVTSFKVNVQLPNANFVGDTFQLKAFTWYEETPGTLTPSGITTYQDVIRCAYDPNDKQVQPNRGGDNPTLLGEPLTYQVRFQNTGNDTAFYVEITDQLDPNLDWSSLTPIAASHPYRVELNGQTGLLRFIFEDITLPDSTTDFEGSQGYVLFTIRPKEGLPANTVVENTADIYFDQNPPIVTNTVRNTYVTKLPTSLGQLAQWDLSLKLSPNPFSEQLGLEMQLDAPRQMELRLFTATGQMIHAQPLELGVGSHRLQLDGSLFPAAGVFFMQIVDKRSGAMISRKLARVP